jgi:hypothetical protein
LRKFSPYKPLVDKPLTAPLFGCLWDAEFFAAGRAAKRYHDDSQDNESKGAAHNPQNQQMAVVQKCGRVIAVDNVAQEHGVQIGWTTGRVLSLAPTCRVLAFNATNEESAWQRVLEQLYELTPKIEPVRSGLAWCEMQLPSLSARADNHKSQWLQLVGEAGRASGLAHDRPPHRWPHSHPPTSGPFIASQREANRLCVKFAAPNPRSGWSFQRDHSAVCSGLECAASGHLRGWTLAHLQAQFRCQNPVANGRGGD